MSLVSAVTGDEANESNGKEQSSVYQTSGKPLSKEALYRAKLKYGVYQSPGQTLPSGVVNGKHASDAAANLANSNKTTIEAYKRLLNPNASIAASAATTPKKAVQPTGNSTPSFAASSAASAAPKAARSRASSSASTTAPSFVSSSAGSPLNSKIPKMDITKVLAGAERNAAESAHLRTNPEKVSYVKGVPNRSAGKAAGASFSLTSDIVSNLPTKKEYIQSAEKESHATEWAQKAVAALKDFNPNEAADKENKEREEKRNIIIKQLTSETVLSKAKLNAQQRLDSIDRDTSQKAIFRNVDFNKAAVLIAQQNQTKNRSASAATANKVNLGGGLWLAPGDIDNIAKGLIAPVLDEVDQRTGAQLAMDVDIQKRDIDYKQQYDAWVAIQTEKENNDSLLQSQAFESHQKETTDLETKLAAKFDKLCKTKDSKVSKLEAALEAKKAELAKLKEDQEEELVQADERKTAECADLEQSNEKDFEQAKKDQEELLLPFRNDLTAAEEHHTSLKNESAEINKSIEELRKSIENHKTHMEELTAQIEEHHQKLAEEEEAFNIQSESHQQLKDDIETNYVVLAEKAKEECKTSAEEARVKQLEVDALINEREAELSNTEIQLKREKLNLISALQEVAEVKKEDKIDEEKAKAFLGTTSGEFLASQKKAEVVSKNPADSKSSEPSGSAKVEAVSGKVDPKAAESASASKKQSTGEFTSPSKSKKKSDKEQKGLSIKKFFGLKQSDKTKHVDAPKSTPSNEVSKTVKTQKPETESTAKKGNTETKSATEVNKNSLEPSFSGFSQGSVRNTVEQSNASEIEGEDVASAKDKRKSLFKEVF
ncbi:unnamed protein product [Kluyveromyces dobzhanskii CBS 2104]|uniref:WGS project CCBQ000000000 data, contig 00015 n=1 Tax=Kluyveromyces dobzhanskii CBS 2104 TaxID=1427455 RepID=A0A0A8LAX6_9SACH|nr:unnamed protein product [Kluyveromyces dobzhanskii CBS 2104]